MLHGLPVKTAPHVPLGIEHSSLESLLYASGALVLAVGFAAYFLRRSEGAMVVLVDRVVWPLRRLQTGVIGDYVAWVVVGTAVIGGVWAIGLR